MSPILMAKWDEQIDSGQLVRNMTLQMTYLLVCFVATEWGGVILIIHYLHHFVLKIICHVLMHLCTCIISTDVHVSQEGAVWSVKAQESVPIAMADVMYVCVGTCIK